MYQYAVTVHTTHSVKKYINTCITIKYRINKDIEITNVGLDFENRILDKILAVHNSVTLNNINYSKITGSRSTVQQG